MDPREQDNAFEKLLAGALRHTASPGSVDCPDPEIFAAYFDRALSSAEALRWEAHFSACARCQEVLAALAHSDARPVGVAESEEDLVGVGVAAPRIAALAAAARVPVEPHVEPRKE